MAIDYPQLKKYFWDIDMDSLDTERHKKYILERLLEMGDEQAVKWMKEVYPNADILKVLKQSRNISKKSLNFWNLTVKEK